MEKIPYCPKVFRVAVARLLGQPVFSSSTPCPLCEQTMDLFGDHSLCCKKSGDTITRHNNLRNLVFKLADTGLLAPELEKLGILGPTDKSRRRPGDVSIKHWSLHRGLAIDVAVICHSPPLTLRNRVSRTPRPRRLIVTPPRLRSRTTTLLLLCLRRVVR